MHHLQHAILYTFTQIIVLHPDTTHKGWIQVSGLVRAFCNIYGTQADGNP